MQTRVFTKSVTTSWAAPVSSIRCGEVTLRNHTGADVLYRIAADSEDAEAFGTLTDGESINIRVQVTSTEVEVKAAAGASGLEVILN